MSQRRVISDPYKFAHEGRSVAGQVPVAQLARLAETQVDDQGVIDYQVVGAIAEDGKSVLNVSVQGTLQVQCQRCLSPMSWPVEFVSVLLLVRSEEEIPEDELEIESRDAIEVEADLDVLTLVEDEILLTVPVVPRHEVCETPTSAAGLRKESPFSVLAGLKKSS